MFIRYSGSFRSHSSTYSYPKHHKSLIEINVTYRLYHSYSFYYEVSVGEYSGGHQRPDIQQARPPFQPEPGPVCKPIRFVGVDRRLFLLGAPPVGDQHPNVHACNTHVDVPFHPSPAAIVILRDRRGCLRLLGKQLLINRLGLLNICAIILLLG